MEYTCCICGKRYLGYGNNPYPCSDNENAKCCDICNVKYVIPLRIANLEFGVKDKKLQNNNID